LMARRVDRVSPSSGCVTMARSATWQRTSALRRSLSASRWACPAASEAFRSNDTYRSPFGKYFTYCMSHARHGQPPHSLVRLERPFPSQQASHGFCLQHRNTNSSSKTEISTDLRDGCCQTPPLALPPSFPPSRPSPSAANAPPCATPIPFLFLPLTHPHPSLCLPLPSLPYQPTGPPFSSGTAQAHTRSPQPNLQPSSANASSQLHGLAHSLSSAAPRTAQLRLFPPPACCACMHPLFPPTFALLPTLLGRTLLQCMRTPVAHSPDPPFMHPL
jgi:hypothetical protein